MGCTYWNLSTETYIVFHLYRAILQVVNYTQLELLKRNKLLNNCNDTFLFSRLCFWGDRSHLARPCIWQKCQTNVHQWIILKVYPWKWEKSFLKYSSMNGSKKVFYLWTNMPVCLGTPSIYDKVCEIRYVPSTRSPPPIGTRRFSTILILWQCRSVSAIFFICQLLILLESVKCHSNLITAVFTTN